MVDDELLVVLFDGCILINVCCGVVVDNSVLFCVLEKGKKFSVVLDVWELELELFLLLLVCVDIGIFYIVGYILEGKVCGII